MIAALLAFSLLATDADKLPDGTAFPRWEQPLQFTRTYYVAQQHPAAADENPGTETRPFRTIQRAADLLQPGERVVIDTGVYRECVRPARGGTGPDAMISYEAAAGATVVVTGAELFHGSWTRSTYAKSSGARPATVWTTQLPRRLFPEGNPFAVMYLSQFQAQRYLHIKNRPNRIPPAALLYRGMIFQNGRRLEQVGDFQQVASAPAGGVFWVEDDTTTLHLRAFGDVDPNPVQFEITTRQQCFAPDRAGLGYLRVKGLTIEKSANGALPRRGALSVNSGHHWLIESNTVRWANAAGIDIGRPSWVSALPEHLGDCVVRGNRISECGSNGICGLGTGAAKRFANLIEGNVLDSNCWQEVESLEESAAIKVLITGSTLIRNNLIRNTLHGPGIWIDMANVNTRCTGNVVLNTHTEWGAIFIEASVLPNAIDHNFIWNSSAAGIYQHDCNDQTFADNFIGHCDGPGIHLRGKVSDRSPNGRPVTGGPNTVTGNILTANNKAIVDKGPPSRLQSNLTEGVTATFDPQRLELKWSAGPGQPFTTISLATTE